MNDEAVYRTAPATPGLLKKNISCHLSPVTFHILRVTFHILRVTSHPSLVTSTNSHSHGPSQCELLQYAQQDDAPDLELDPCIIGHKDPQIYFFPGSKLKPFLNQNFHFLNLRSNQACLKYFDISNLLKKYLFNIFHDK